jgi:hypothetical protein
MPQSSSIASQIDAVLVAAKWPQGQSSEQSLSDIQAVMKLMNSKLSSGTTTTGPKPADASGPGPHG